MRLNLTLRRRIERVEKRLGERKPLPKVFMAIHPDERPGAIIGIEGNGRRVFLKAGETLASLRARAEAELPARILHMLYSPARAAPEPSRAPTPIAAPVEPPRPVPGVGRFASREELVKMGALAVLPERLI